MVRNRERDLTHALFAAKTMEHSFSSLANRLNRRGENLAIRIFKLLGIDSKYSGRTVKSRVYEDSERNLSLAKREALDEFIDKHPEYEAEIKKLVYSHLIKTRGYVGVELIREGEIPLEFYLDVIKSLGLKGNVEQYYGVAMETYEILKDSHRKPRRAVLPKKVYKPKKII